MPEPHQQGGIPPALLASVPVRRPDAYAADMDDGSVVYRGTELHRLDALGTLVWQLLDGKSTLAAISADVADAFGEDHDRCARDIATFARQLADAGLITLEHPT